MGHENHREHPIWALFGGDFSPVFWRFFPCFLTIFGRKSAKKINLLEYEENG